MSACPDAVEEEELDSRDGVSNENVISIVKTSEISIPLEPPSLKHGHDAIEGLGSQDGTSNDTLTAPLERSETPSILESPSFDPQSSYDVATFVRQKEGWASKEQYRLKNSLLVGVGLLELANAGDFAANVWNQVPVPHFAAALSTLSINAVLPRPFPICSLCLFLLCLENLSWQQADTVFAVPLNPQL
jgi:hypothetical protein